MSRRSFSCTWRSSCLPAGAKARHHFVERLAELAVLVVRDRPRPRRPAPPGSPACAPRTSAAIGRVSICASSSASNVASSESADAPGEDASRVRAERRHRFGLVDLGDDAPAQRIEIDRSVRHQGRHTAVVVERFHAGLAAQRRACRLVLAPGRSRWSCRASRRVDRPGGQGRSPQCVEERRAILDQESGIACASSDRDPADRLRRSSRDPPPPIARCPTEALLIGSIGRRRIMIASSADHRRSVCRRTPSGCPSAGRYASKSATL